MRKFAVRNKDEDKPNGSFKTYFNKPPDWFSVLAVVLLIIFIGASVAMMPHLFASMERSRSQPITPFVN